MDSFSRALATLMLLVTATLTPMTLGVPSAAANHTALAPVVANVTPREGRIYGGTTVLIDGNDFREPTAVFFGSVPAASFRLARQDATQIIAKAPAHPQPGTVNITVMTEVGQSASTPADEFTYFDAPPAITSINPTSGPAEGGTDLVIVGDGYHDVEGPAVTRVQFGSVTADYRVLSEREIVVRSPAHVPGAADITVTGPGGRSVANATSRFRYGQGIAPRVAAVDPSSGPIRGGTQVVVTGEGFTNVSAVTFGEVAAASFSVESPTRLTATSPPQNRATVDVTVTTAAGTSDSNTRDRFTYYDESGPPIVTGVDPVVGPSGGGTSVVISGQGLNGARAVRFGSVAAACFQVQSDTQIAVTSPAQSAGVVDIMVTTPLGTSPPTPAGRFTYDGSPSPRPSVESLSPPAGPTSGGTTVTITGTGFCNSPRPGVKFGDLPASDVVLVSGTSLVATSPAYQLGVVDVTVTTPAGTSGASDAARFTYAPGSWVATGCNPSSTCFARFWHNAVVLDGPGCQGTPQPASFCGDVLVVGGDVYGSAYLYDPAEGSWSRAGQMTVGRAFSVPDLPARGFTATLLGNGKVLVAGGCCSDSPRFHEYPGNAYASAEVFDPASREWTKTADMTTNRTGHTATLLPDGKVLVVGGAADYDSYQVKATAEVYDPEDGTWTAAGIMSTARVSHTANVLPDGTVLVVGGFGHLLANPGYCQDPERQRGCTEAPLRSVSIFNPATGLSADEDLPIPRVGHSATTLGDGRILVAGGIRGYDHQTGSTIYDSSAGLYDPKSGWNQTASMRSARAEHTSTALSGGKVLVAGGSPAGVASEVYDPVNNRWEDRPPLKDARSLHVAVPLYGPMCGGPSPPTYCDDVLAVGGVDPTSGRLPARSAEMFTPAPEVAAVYPELGPTAGGSSVTIRGSGFSRATSVAFGGVSARSFRVDSPTQITAVTPRHPPGDADVVVTSPAGPSIALEPDAAVRFTYVQSGGSPPDPTLGPPTCPQEVRGYLLDGWGGLHPTGDAPQATGGPYWFGWDIARDVTPNPTGPGGYVLDGWGGLHSFNGAERTASTGYWRGWDIARALTMRQSGGGWVLDGWGGLHPIGDPGPSFGGPYWFEWDIARDVAANPSGPGGWVLDGWGGMHAFGGAPPVAATGYWFGWDIARKIVLNPSGPGGWVVDGWGGMHPFAPNDQQLPRPPANPSYPLRPSRDAVVTAGGAGQVVSGFGSVAVLGTECLSAPRWPGWDIARAFAPTT